MKMKKNNRAHNFNGNFNIDKENNHGHLMRLHFTKKKGNN